MNRFQRIWIKWLLECKECALQIGLLFNYEKGKGDRSSCMGYRRVRTNAFDFVKENECFGLSEKK